MVFSFLFHLCVYGILIKSPNVDVTMLMQNKYHGVICNEFIVNQDFINC